MKMNSSVHRCLTIYFLILTSFCFADFDARKEVIKLMERSGMQKYLNAPVKVSSVGDGVLSISDKGIFAIQHELLSADVATDPNVTIVGDIHVRPSVNKLVIVTHGWLDKGEKDWPSRLAAAIGQRVDPNEWVCASYDWKGGSVVITSVQAAQYARDVAGPRLAAAILNLGLGIDLEHVHLLAHSAGSWTIHSAAKQLAAADPNTAFHLTFLDAYVPEKWNPEILGHIFVDAGRQRSQVWAEQYFTKDITYKVTQRQLPNAHNVDISAIDTFIVEHEFPYRWYAATVTGHYDRWDEKKEPVITRSGETEYGFARSREAGEINYTQTRKLILDNTPVKFEKEKK